MSSCLCNQGNMKVNKQGTAVGLPPGLEGNGARLFLLRSISSSSLVLQGWSQAQDVCCKRGKQGGVCLPKQCLPPAAEGCVLVVVWPALLLMGKETQECCDCPSSLLPLASWLQLCMLLDGSRRHQRLHGDRHPIWLCCKHKSAKCWGTSGGRVALQYRGTDAKVQTKHIPLPCSPQHFLEEKKNITTPFWLC